MIVICHTQAQDYAYAVPPVQIPANIAAVVGTGQLRFGFSDKYDENVFFVTGNVDATGTALSAATVDSSPK